MQITRELAKGQIVALNFFQANVPASQTDVQLLDASNQVVGLTVPFNGELIAIVADTSVAATAGSLTISVTVNTVKNANYVATITTGTTTSLKVQRNKVRVLAGDRVGVRITTNAAWNGTTADLVVGLYMLQELDGI